MDLSQDLIIDVALNVAGYIAAAGLMLTVFSLFRKKDGANAWSSARTAVAVPVGHQPAAVKPGGGSRMEFLSLSDKFSPSGDARTNEKEDKPNDGRRDRAEIIRVAREMLKAGATTEKISSILPISQAELALLSAGRR